MNRVKKAVLLASALIGASVASFETASAATYSWSTTTRYWSPVPQTTAPQTTAPQTATPVASSLQSALTEVNRLRAQAGVAAVRLNSLLNKAAQLHAQDMVNRHYFSHSSPDGRNPGTRITQAGYQWMTYGENIAQGYASWTDAIRGWMNSPGHRANMLNSRFTEMGLGVQNRIYVQVFATPRR